jgi:putative transposase
MVTPDVKRDAVAHVCVQHGVSQRRACEVLSVDRSSMRYRSVRPDDASIREAMKKVASERRRFGYRRIHVMLDRQGIVMNLKKLRRLYREEKLTVRKRGGRKRALGTRRPLALPSRPNERWSLDFVSDAFTDGRRFRVLAVVDDFTRECLALVADTSLSGARLARELDSLIARRGKPKTIVSDNGTEMTSMAILKWCQETHVEWHYIAPRQADAERLCRKLQWQLPRRVPERDPVLVTRSSPRRHHRMEGGLQQEQTPLIAGQHYSQRVRNENGYGKTGRIRPD